jgi:spermine/spermidine synthase
VTNAVGQTGSLRRAGIALALTSFVSLFQELTLIRWVGTEVRVMAYFPNVVLIAAFLGLGVGSMRARKSSMLWLWPVALVVIVSSTLLMSRVAFTSRSPSERLWLLYYDIPHALVIPDVRLPILLVFFFTAISFLPLGQIIGACLQDFARAGVALQGYMLDLAGSLVGVIAFACFSFALTRPTTWFAVVVLAGTPLFFRRAKKLLVLQAAVAVAIVLAIMMMDRNAVYSPYYALRARRSPTGVQVLANGSFHQYAAPLRKNDRVVSAFDVKIRDDYSIPYALLWRKPRNVLVLGAGSGNDVAIALDNGADRVDAVEIDPVIIQMGRSIHPDRPYLSPRVRAINDDARAFLRSTDRRYDLIVFGTLDSMTRLSALSNVRLDNFVYTVESMRAARSRLTPDGGVALYFMVQDDAIHNKLFSMLTEAFGEPPIVVHKYQQLFNTIYLVGPAWKSLHTPEQDAMMPLVLGSLSAVDVPTDDWPYLYLTSRKISGFYWSMTLLLTIVGALLIALLAPELRRAVAHFDAEMFLFGAAFLLLETKLVTQMSLVWSTTWITSAVVFSSILVMLLAGTIAVQRWTLPYPVAASGLTAALLIAYVTPSSWLLVPSIAGRLILSLLFVGGPVFFASICFAQRFKTRVDPNLAFGWNLAGAVAGGLIEILAVVVGLRALTLVALVAYLAAFLVHRRRGPLEALAR